MSDSVRPHRRQPTPLSLGLSMLGLVKKLTGFIFLKFHFSGNSFKKRLIKISFREIKQNLNIKFEYIHPTFPTINIPYHSSVFTTIHEPTMTHHITQNLWFTLGFFLVCFMDLTSNFFFLLYFTKVAVVVTD